jgi:hypothetical protein
MLPKPKIPGTQACLWKISIFLWLIYRRPLRSESAGEIQLTHERRFLGLVRSHPRENIAKETHRVDDVRTFIKHHTLCTA